MMTPQAKLRDQIAFYFNLSELQNLAFDLGINHEEIAGDTLSDQARELVAHCVRYGLLNQLVRRCRELRSHGRWHDLYKKKPILDPSCGTGGFLFTVMWFMKV